jgi:Fe2+ or Zn2+ uptake regulation protein
MTALKPSTAHSPSAKATGIEARCAATGMRMTEQRRVIARVLAEAEDLDLDGVSHRKTVRGCRDYRAA